MPFFQWAGLDAAGNYHAETMRAHSLAELTDCLKEKDIALLHYKQIYPKAARQFCFKHKTLFFRQLASLVNSGIYVDQALQLLTLQEKSKHRKELLNDLYLEVHQGNSLSAVFRNYPTIFDPLTLQVIEAGQHSGLIHSLQTIAQYHDDLNEFKTKMRQALMLPLITALFFTIATVFIFIIIMPTFAALFSSFNQPLPPLTRLMFNASQTVRSRSFIAAFIGGAIIFWISFRLLAQYSHKIRYGCLQLIIPYIPGSTFVCLMHLNRFFQSLTVLLESGTPIKAALETVQTTLNDSFFSSRLQKVVDAVLQGTAFDDALSQDPLLFSQDIIAYIRIGHETGNLVKLLRTIVACYQEQIYKKLSFYTTIMQPALMIILGLWIALLIVAIYLPIFTLSYAIS